MGHDWEEHHEEWPSLVLIVAVTRRLSYSEHAVQICQLPGVSHHQSQHNLLRCREENGRVADACSLVSTEDRTEEDLRVQQRNAQRERV